MKQSKKIPSSLEEAMQRTYETLEGKTEHSTMTVKERVEWRFEQAKEKVIGWQDKIAQSTVISDRTKSKLFSALYTKTPSASQKEYIKWAANDWEAIEAYEPDSEDDGSASEAGELYDEEE